VSKKPVLTDEQTGEVIGGGLAKANPNASVNPTVTDDDSAGYAIGSVWLNATTGVSFNCTDATTGAAVWIAIGGGAADMEKATYDPTSVEDDAFDMDNMAEGATTKILTDTERAAIAANSGFVSGDGASNTSHRTTVTGNPHAVSGDELNSDAQPAGKIIETDGAGGFVYLDTPSGGGTAGGANRQIQINDSGSFGADANFQITADAGLACTYKDASQTSFQQNNEGKGCIQFGANIGTYSNGSNRIIGSNGTTARGSLSFGCLNSRVNYGCYLQARGKGCFAGGYAGTSTGYVNGGQYLQTSNVEGAFAFGCLYMDASGYGRIESEANGAVVMGYAKNEAELKAESGGVGSFVFGHCDGSGATRSIKTQGKGAFALGFTDGLSILASGDGSVAWNNGANATAAGAFMLNRGTNSVADSVKFGGAGYGGELHILGGSQYADPGSPVNGQMWATYNFYYATHAIKCRVNGVTKDFTNIP